MKRHLGIWDGLPFFMNNYQYGSDDYINSTVLVDINRNIVAFFDRWTTEINVIDNIDYEHKRDKILECLSDDARRVKVIPHSIKTVKLGIVNPSEFRKVTKERGLADDIRKELHKINAEYNKNYFRNLINRNG